MIYRCLQYIRVCIRNDGEVSTSRVGHASPILDETQQSGCWFQLYFIVYAFHPTFGIQIQVWLTYNYLR